MKRKRPRNTPTAEIKDLDKGREPLGVRREATQDDVGCGRAELRRVRL